MNELVLRGIERVGVDVEEMDITDHIACETATSQEKPDAVIHCATYIVVDVTEDNLELCRRVNVEGMCNIARVCKAMDIKMMYINMDYVFSGGGQRSWELDDHREPFNIYRLTEYEGEIAVKQNIQKHFTICIAWVFGTNGRNFVKTTFRLGKERGAVPVVNNQVGSSTYTYDLTRLLVDMIQTGKYGRYHATDEGLCNWYKLTCEIFRQAGVDKVKVTPVDSGGSPTKAKRSSNSRMSKEKLTKNGFERLPLWQDVLGRYLKAPKENGMA